MNKDELACKEENKNRNKIKRYIRDAIYILVWIGLILKIFVIDWDVFLIEKYLPQMTWILKYRILGLVVLILITSKMKIWNIILNALYFIFFPVIILFAFIPFKTFSLGRWNGIISYINTFIIFFKHFRYKIVMAILYILSLILTLKSHNKIVLIGSIIFNIYCIIGLIKSIFKIAFCDSEIYSAYKKLVNKIMNRKTGKENEYLKITSIEELKENKELVSMVETRLLINRLLLFSAKKLKDYNNSKSYIFQDVILFITTVIIGIISFSLINYGIFKIENLNYRILEGIPTFIDFILYTISCSNGYILPITMLTKILEIVKALIFFIFSGLFVCTFLEGSKKKQKDGIESVIASINDSAKMEENKIIKQELFEDIDSAIKGLQQMHSSLVGIILKITENL